MFGNLTILSLHEGHFMLCNKEEFQKFCEYEFIICYFVSPALIKTSGTSGALPKVGENRLRDQLKEYRDHGQTEKRRLIDLSAILKALFSNSCYLFAPDHMPRRSTDGEHFFTTWRLIILGCHHIIGLFSETISGQRCTVLGF